MKRVSVPRSPSPARSTTSNSDEDEEEEDFDIDRSGFYVDDNSIDQAQPQSPAQTQFRWINQLNNLSISSSDPHSHVTDLPAPSPANSLPHEILIHIFRNVHSIRDLHSALLVSRAWCQCSVELLWHKPSFSGLAFLFKLLHIITRKDQIFSYATFIRRLNFTNQALDLNDQLFVRLSSCVRLERLTLIGCSLITDDALIKVFTACPNLVALDLTHVAEVTDKAIIALALSAHKLQGINLGHCKKITDEGIFAISQSCPTLRRIKLFGLDLLTNASISALARRCPLLLEIDLNKCSLVTGVAIRDLWTYSLHLRELRLPQVTALTDDAFPDPPPPPKPNGTAINPFPPRPDSPTLSPLLLSRPFDHLRLLDLTSCAHLTDDAIEGIVSNTPKIRHLTLAKCTGLTDDAVISLSKLGRYLHYIHLGHVTAITDRGVTTLARSCLRLRYVDLACCSSLTDLSVLELSALPKLRRIGLVRVPNLTDQAVLALADRHSSLERIHLSYCEQISVSAVYHLLQKLHKLTHLSLTGVPAFREKELQRFCRAAPQEFNLSQRAAFCVFSGPGIADLRRYLHAMAREMDRLGNGPDDIPDPHFESDSDDGSTADDAVLLPRQPHRPPVTERSARRRGPQIQPPPPNAPGPSTRETNVPTLPLQAQVIANGRHPVSTNSDPVVDLSHHNRQASTQSIPPQVRSPTTPFYNSRLNGVGSAPVIEYHNNSSTSTATASSSSIHLGGSATPDLNFAETGTVGSPLQRSQRGREPRANANPQPSVEWTQWTEQFTTNIDPRLQRSFLSPPLLDEDALYANSSSSQHHYSLQLPPNRNVPLPHRPSTAGSSTAVSPPSSRRSTVRGSNVDTWSDSLGRELEEFDQAAVSPNGSPMNGREGEGPEGRGRERGRRLSMLRNTINAANALFGRGAGSSGGTGGRDGRG